MPWQNLRFRTAGRLVVAPVSWLIFAGCGITSAPSDVSAKIDELFQTIADDTFDATYRSATTPEFRKATSEADYKRIGDVVRSRLGGLRSKQVSGLNVRFVNGVGYADASYKA